ncbi:MAG: hypothetical protein JWN86_2528 [Planctomycetota bacterium]|nr:hypothetical protein [Planctomycetota bacterium]
MLGDRPSLASDDHEADTPRGRELFLREWVPGVFSTRGGDGLGPVYNDTSCVACHNLGGPGGGGSASKNIDLLTASPVSVSGSTTEPEARLGLRGASSARSASLARDERVRSLIASGRIAPPETPPDRVPLMAFHDGFRDFDSVVLHRFGVDDEYESWRMGVVHHSVSRQDQPARATAMGTGAVPRAGEKTPPPHGPFLLSLTQRNATALFGAGLIDSVPDHVIEAQTRSRHEGFPEIRGRAALLPNGQFGRFGWKGQGGSLEDFVLGACAIELGLEVPGHPQAAGPEGVTGKPPGLDLSAEDCVALTNYVRSLPRPAEQAPLSPDEVERIRLGKILFRGVGCAECHVPSLGSIKGIYSDLLLHDMGTSLGDRSVGRYGRTSKSFVEAGFPAGPAAFQGGRRALLGPSRDEWRTPPLWGLRDSGPYLHDGSADTLEEAVVRHGGEAEPTAQRYAQLTARQRRDLQAFLATLVAPNLTAPNPARPAPAEQRNR